MLKNFRSPLFPNGDAKVVLFFDSANFFEDFFNFFKNFFWPIQNGPTVSCGAELCNTLIINQAGIYLLVSGNLKHIT